MDKSYIKSLTKEEMSQANNLMTNIIEKNKIVSVTKLNDSKSPTWRRLSTGCKVLDNVLDGGIPVRGITEISGEAGAGKTQICLQLALTVQYPIDLGGLAAGAVYICTEGTFPMKRLNELCLLFPKKFQINEQISFTDNIFIEHVMSPDQLDVCINRKVPLLLKQKKIGLIVIDSIAGIFRYEYEKGSYLERSKDINMISTKLHQLSDEHNLAVVCLNQVTDNVTDEKAGPVPALGLTWSNAVTTRLFLSRNSTAVVTSGSAINVCNRMREFKVVSAPDLPTRTCPFVITSSGVEGVD